MKFLKKHFKGVECKYVRGRNAPGFSNLWTLVIGRRGRANLSRVVPFETLTQASAYSVPGVRSISSRCGTLLAGPMRILCGV
jgi:hypothetical protein